MKKSFYLIVSTMLVFMLSYSVLAANPGTTPSTAVKVNYNQTYYGGWYKGNDHLNYYVSFEVKQKGLITFEYSKPLDDEGEYGSMLFKVYNENDDYIWFHNTREDKDTPKETLSYTIALDEGTYLMNVTPGFSVTSGYIEFYYRFKFEADDYCETEPNNTIPEATVTELGKFYKGIFGTCSSGEGSDNCDYFKFQVTKGVSYRVRFKSIKKLEPTTALLDVIMNSKSVDGFSGFYYMDDQYDNDGYAYEDFTAPETGYAYLKLYNYIGTPIEYEFEIDKVPCNHEYVLSSTKEPTCAVQGEKIYKCTSCGNTYSEAIPTIPHNYSKSSITKNPTCVETGIKTYFCSCGTSYDVSIPTIAHMYSETITKPATCTETGIKTFICACNDSYTETIATVDHVYTSTVTQEPTCWSEGVTTYTCTCGDSYTETIEKKEHEYRPWETKVKPKCTQPGMEWSYCLICDSDFEREIPATGHTVIEYVMRATTDEQAAYGGDGAYITACDVCNEVFKQEFFARPAEYILSTTECTYNGKARKPSVTVKDADGKTLVEGQDYDLIYPDEMRLPGKYNIEVFFKGNYLGGKDLTFTIAPKATTGVKAKTQTTSSITLTWTKTTGATGYRVYQYSPSKGEYVLKKSVKGTTTYKVTGLKAGTTYKFKIKPYVKSDDGTVIWGSASSALSTATKPSTPTVKSVTASSGKATLSWNNISGESGYQVYYSTSKNGTYKKMKSVSTDTVKYTTSKLTAGKTYYFKVRAYKKVDGKTVYGSFSSIKNVKIK